MSKLDCLVHCVYNQIIYLDFFSEQIFQFCLQKYLQAEPSEVPKAITKTICQIELILSHLKPEPKMTP